MIRCRRALPLPRSRIDTVRRIVERIEQAHTSPFESTRMGKATASQRWINAFGQQELLAGGLMVAYMPARAGPSAETRGKMNRQVSAPGRSRRKCQDFGLKPPYCDRSERMAFTSAAGTGTHSEMCVLSNCALARDPHHAALASSAPASLFAASAMPASVVIIRPAMDAASCRAMRTTLAGSMMPFSIMSPYSSACAS
jgi:hypothetical protein